jgi:hypothetical protein
MKRWSPVMAVVLSLAVAVTVQSATKPTGILKVPVGLSLELKVDGKPALVPTGRDVPSPVGTYTPASLTCGAMTTTGTGAYARQVPPAWTIKVAPPNWGKLKEIKIVEGETTTIEAGPPFTLKTLVYAAKTAPTGEKVIPFTVRIYGKAGELYDYNTLMAGSMNAPQIGLQVVDEKGKVLVTGTLPYG